MKGITLQKDKRLLKHLKKHLITFKLLLRYAFNRYLLRFHSW